MLKKLLIVLPCYNEEEILPYSIKTIKNLLEKMIKEKLISPQSRACFVNDGSTDKSWEIIKKECHKKESLFSGINLSKNFGHQSAILAGMYDSEADLYVTIDTDLQDNPECIVEMIEKIKQGNDIVYGVRKQRTTDTFFKRITALTYYKFLSLLGVKIIQNHADFRMMTKRVVEQLKRFPEKNLFLRAIVPLVGFKTDNVYYDRSKRIAGETKYPLSKMVALAWNGISSFSIIPLRLVTFTGFTVCFISVIFLLILFYRWSVGGTIVGWASTITVITVFSGIQILSIGIIGEYIAKIFIEVKDRPLYIIDEKIGFDKKKLDKTK
ncbi:MAG: glycosyltransferase family 2 protein [Alphaproteobacteria bacterium]